AVRQGIGSSGVEEVVPAVAASDRRIGKVLARVHEGLQDDWTVEALARVASMSRSAFAERFRELVGEAPMRYVSRLRLTRARRLLSSTDLTVAQIAASVGYGSESSLSRALKASVGR